MGTWSSRSGVGGFSLRQVIFELGSEGWVGWPRQGDWRTCDQGSKVQSAPLRSSGKGVVMGTESEGAWCEEETCEEETGEAGRARCHRPCIHFRIWTFPRESSGNQRRATAEEWLDQTCLLKKSLWLQWRQLIRKARGGCGEALVVCGEVLRERQQNRGEVNAFTRCLGGKHSGARCSRVREMRDRRTSGL